VDLTEPGLAFSGTLTMPILRALDGRSKPASAAQVARTVAAGTPAGVRRALERLSLHGLCTKEELGGRSLYSLNYDHVLYGAVRQSLEADGNLVKRLRDAVVGWRLKPIAAILFGSAARRDGDVYSDIDLLLLHPRMTTTARERHWAPQLHELRALVRRWSGNHLQVLDWSQQSLRKSLANKEVVLNEIQREGVLLYGRSFASLLDGT